MLSIIGTLLLLGAGGTAVYMMKRRDPTKRWQTGEPKRREAIKVRGTKHRIPDDLKTIEQYLGKTSKRRATLLGWTKQRVWQDQVQIRFFGHRVSVNKRFVNNFLAVDRAVTALGIPYQFKVVWTYNWRFTRKSQAGLSNTLDVSPHAWGTAVDINPSTNPVRVTSTTGTGLSKRVTDIPIAVINIFKQNNFHWGGNWTNYNDPMHFGINV